MKAVHWFYSGCAALVIVIYGATDTWPLSTVFNVAEFAFAQNEEWWRDWIGALSGWIAAAGALAAALLTLPHLKKQADEAKRQADFALGEANPTFDVYSEEFIDVYFRIVNWNRRTFLLDRISFDGLSFVTVSEVNTKERIGIPLWEFDLPDNYEPEFNNALRIPGYENRNEPPMSCRIKAKVFRQEGMGVTTATFFAEGRLLGEKHERIVLKATADVRPFWT